MFSPVEAFLTLPYTGMVYVLSCRGFLVVIVHRDGVCSLLLRLSCCYRAQGWCMFSPAEAFLLYRTQGWCMFSPVEAFLMLSYTGMVYVSSPVEALCSLLRCFLLVIVHRDGVCSLL